MVGSRNRTHWSLTFIWMTYISYVEHFATTDALCTKLLTAWMCSKYLPIVSNLAKIRPMNYWLTKQTPNCFPVHLKCLCTIKSVVFLLYTSLQEYCWCLADETIHLYSFVAYTTCAQVTTSLAPQCTDFNFSRVKLINRSVGSKTFEKVMEDAYERTFLATSQYFTVTLNACTFVRFWGTLKIVFSNFLTEDPPYSAEISLMDYLSVL